jgi:predicted unusual protein kinase regulating ubiquinone biosynthesis (AarF/ABC1/UbiB family)
VFEGLDEDTLPVAAASLGQVYRLRLRATGQEVAVKVQRPDMVRAVSLDLYLLRLYAHTVERVKASLTAWGILAPRRSFDVALIEAFSAASFAELDYGCEAENARRFARDLLPLVPEGSVAVPAVVAEASSRRVLTTEWIDGERLADADAATIRRLVPVGVQCFLAQLLATGFFHADPHPGNLLVNREGQLVLIDFGLCADIKHFDADAMTAAILHLVAGDVPALVQDAIKLGFLPEDVELEALLPALRSVFDRAAALRFEMDQKNAVNGRERTVLHAAGTGTLVDTAMEIEGVRGSKRALCPWHNFLDSIVGRGEVSVPTIHTTQGGHDSVDYAQDHSPKYRPAERRRVFKAISHELNQIFFDYPFTVPPYFALITRALILLEGIAVSGDPAFDLFRAAEPYARQHALRTFGASNLIKIAGAGLTADEEAWRESVQQGLNGRTGYVGAGEERSMTASSTCN